MIKVIPAILAKTKAEFDKKVERLTGLVDWIQVDIYPGLYWRLDVPFKVEAHVMLPNPDLNEFQKADRIVVHQGVVSWARKDYALVLAVIAGKSGQKFNPEALDEIKKLRGRNPNIDIAVDGGINLETGKLAVEAGANILISGSYLFNSKNIKEAIFQLSKE